MSKVSVASLRALAERQPDLGAWCEATEMIDQLPAARLSAAVAAFEAASRHWPSDLQDWVPKIPPGRFLADKPHEVRESPLSWVEEIYRGLPSEKHRLVRILDSPRRDMRGHRLEHLLSATRELSRVVEACFVCMPLPSAFLKLWSGEGPWRTWARVKLFDCALKPAQLKQLANADLAAVRTLLLAQNSFGAKGAGALRSAPGWRSLRELDLSNNQIGEEGVSALASAPWISQLERLDLSSNEVSDEGFARLACRLPRLAWLSLDDDPLGAKPDAWVKALPALSLLSMAGTDLTDQRLSCLLSAASPALSGLVLAKTEVSDKGAKALAASGRALTVLDISKSKIGAAGTEALLTAPALQGLETLNLCVRGVTEKNVKLLMDGALPALRRLSWQYEHTGEDPDDGVLALIEKSRLKKLMTTSAGAM